MLFTVAFLMLTPAVVDCARVTHQTRFRDISSYPEAGIAWDQVVVPNYRAPLGITSLVIIAMGLLVTWAGYFKGLRWTWLVMFVIVSVWALPVLVLPNFRPWGGVALVSASAFASMTRDSLRAGPSSFIARAILKGVLAFLLMLLALALPAKTFVLDRKRRPGRPGHTDPGAEDSNT
jgi:hypothetical protein